jgi:hypothetical protein
MSGFRGGLALDLVDLGCFQAARSGCDRDSGHTANGKRVRVDLARGLLTRALLAGTLGGDPPRAACSYLRGGSGGIDLLIGFG